MPATPRESVWSRPDRRSRGPVPQHTRAEIVAAATALADQGGLDAVSMRAVAAALDTAAGSLYRYLSSRDDLLDLMVDAALSELPAGAPAAGDWLDGLIGVARDQLALYRRHPWLSEAARRVSTFGPNTITYFERCLAIMAPLPQPASVKMEAVAVLTGVVTLFATPTPMNPPPDDPQAVQRQQAAAAQLFAMLDPVTHPHLTAAFTAAAPPPEAPDLLERTIRGVLRGLLT
ncbi:TetR/AcrR family transcriptional regulator [Dactylosporangium aurantiacum]|nr:TetR family transcriptional regulator [Dactylosporangium aurantiacum]MDG6103410.1 TetR family transcriptional regulator [Dactylosporangium aurantiacum]